MNENRGNTGQNNGRHIANVPQRSTTENFRLNLSEEQMNTGTIHPVRSPQEPRNAQMRQSYNKQAYTEAERKQEAKAHKKRNKIKAGKNKLIFKIIWLAMVILLALTLASYLIDGAYDFLAANRKQETMVEFEIPENVTVDQLSDILEQTGAINEKEFFKLYFKITSEDDLAYVRVGPHTLKSNMDYQEIIDNLMAGEASAVATITVVEGSNAVDIANLLEENKVCSAESFLNELNSSKYQSESYPEIQALMNTTERYYLLEGYLYPDTYFFYENSTPSEVVDKFLANFSTKIEFLNSRIAESGRSLDEIMVMASIIQREAADVTDMYRVSAVLHNRLNFGAEYDIFTLDCDSTMYYPYHKRDDAPEGYASSYNTYAISGLPMGAISNPGTDAIKAALMPDDEYSASLYFCHSADGTAYYADTAEQHQENLVLAGLA